MVACKRSLAMCLDLFGATAISCIPAVFQMGASGKPQGVFDCLLFMKDGLSSGGLGASLLVVLVFTPIPIVYWRIFFKAVMNGPTPGETIAGIVTYSTKAGLSKWANEIRWGLGQYLLLLISTICATALYSLFFSLLTRLLWPHSLDPVEEYPPMMLFVMLSTLPLMVAAIKVASHMSFSKKNYQSVLDFGADTFVAVKKKVPKQCAISPQSSMTE